MRDRWVEVLEMKRYGHEPRMWRAVGFGLYGKSSVKSWFGWRGVGWDCEMVMETSVVFMTRQRHYVHMAV